MLVSVVLPQPIFPATAICIIFKLTSLMLMARYASVYGFPLVALRIWSYAIYVAAHLRSSAATYLPKLKVFGTKESKQLRIYLIHHFSKILWIIFKIQTITFYHQYAPLVLFEDKLLVSFV